MTVSRPADPNQDRCLFILEDDPILRGGLVFMLTNSKLFGQIVSAGSLAEGHQQLAKLSQMPDAFLVDLGMPDGSGLDFIKKIKQESDAKILVFSVFGDQASVIDALEAGADGFVLKDATEIDLTKAVESVLSGGSPISASAAAHLLRRLRPHVTETKTDSPAPTDFGLTARERQILEMLARGFSQKDVARIANISPHTVGAHIKSIYAKMSVNSRTEAVYEAIQSGLLNLGKE